MATRKTYNCGLEAALAVIGGRWKFLVLWTLAPAPRRFGELRRQIPGISEKMLTQVLKDLTLDRVVSRHDFHEVPPRVEYAMTEFGRSLAETLVPLCDWGLRHMQQIASLPTQEACALRAERRAAGG
jgi:DNA-binding HxlR family transcriptional regulator